MKKTHDAYIALGSNLGNSKDFIQRAIQEINVKVGKVLESSKLYTTSPLKGYTNKEEQSDYLNLLVKAETTLSPEKLMTTLLEIENSLGRTREKGERWSARTIDLDIILLGDISYNSKTVIIPHPRYQTRDFILRGLIELHPNYKDSTTKRTAFEAYKLLSDIDKTIINEMNFEIICNLVQDS